MISRRQFIAALSASALAPAAGAAEPVSGKDYLLVQPPVTLAPGPVIVHDFFAYTCPHCLTFAPYMDRYRASLPRDGSVRVIAAPIAWSEKYDIFVRAYFVFEALGRLDEMHMPFWEWIIKGEHDWKDDQAMTRQSVDWLLKHGLTADEWDKVGNSFAVATKTRQARSLWKAYGVSSTPCVGVAGRWLTAPHLTGTRPKAIEVLKYLVAQAQRG